MPHQADRRIQVSPPYPTKDKTVGIYDLIDSTDGYILAQHRFPWFLAYPNGNRESDEWFDAHRKIAQSIADALNAVPNAAIEHIRQTQREAVHIREMAEKPHK